MGELAHSQFNFAVSIGRFAREGLDPDLFPSEMVDADRVDLNRLLDWMQVPQPERERRYRQIAYAGVGAMPAEYADAVLGYLTDYGFLTKRDAGAIAVRVSVPCLRKLLKRYTKPDDDLYYGALLAWPGLRLPERVEGRLLALALERLDIGMAKHLAGSESWEEFVRYAATIPEPAALLRRLLVGCGCEIPPDVWETLPETVQNELSPYVPVLESLSKRVRLDA